jgi:phosphoribosylformylglycinamidine synthase
MLNAGESPPHVLLFARLNFSTAFSTNAVSICHSIGLEQVSRIEASIRYLLEFDVAITADVEDKIVMALHDKMTQCRYMDPIASFHLDISPENVCEVDIMGRGKAALQEVNSHLGERFINICVLKVQEEKRQKNCFMKVMIMKFQTVSY